jgi:hypothetical protein
MPLDEYQKYRKLERYVPPVCGLFLTAPWIQGTDRSSVTPRIWGAIFAVNHGSASHVNIALGFAEDIYLRV